MAIRIAALTDTQLTRAKPIETRYPLRDGNDLELIKTVSSQHTCATAQVFAQPAP